MDRKAASVPRCQLMVGWWFLARRQRLALHPKRQSDLPMEDYCAIGARTARLSSHESKGVNSTEAYTTVCLYMIPWSHFTYVFWWRNFKQYFVTFGVFISPFFDSSVRATWTRFLPVSTHVTPFCSALLSPPPPLSHTHTSYTCSHALYAEMFSVLFHSSLTTLLTSSRNLTRWQYGSTNIYYIP